MDIEKLIEQLKYYGTTYAIGDNLGKEIDGSDELMLNAATALSTLQAKNEKLRDEVESLKKGHCAGCSVPVVKTGQLKDLNDAPKLRAELEQVKRDRAAAVDCIYQIEDDLDRGSDNDWAREHISEWESQKED